MLKESRNALDGLRKLQGKNLWEEAQGRILEEQISTKLYEQKVVLEIGKIKAQWLKAEAKYRKDFKQNSEIAQKTTVM